MANRWAFLNQSTVATASGQKLDAASLAKIAYVCEVQLNADYGPECGGQDASVRVVTSETVVDLAGGEKIYYFVDALPDAPGASAYHIPNAAYCAVTTCQDLFGPEGVSVDASHELLEDAGNPGCNRSLDDGQGQEHEDEVCDPVEVQTYPIADTSGTPIHVSNFVLPSWKIPGSPGPYTFMAKHGIEGYVEPKGPFQSAKSEGGSGNYQLVFPSASAEMKQVFARGKTNPESENPARAIVGFPRKRSKVFHWTSRVSRILKRRANERAATIPEETPPGAA